MAYFEQFNATDKKMKATPFGRLLSCVQNAENDYN